MGRPFPWAASGECPSRREIELGSYQAREVSSGMPHPQLDFEVERHESMKQVAGQEQQKQEHHQRIGLMFVDMICMPIVDEFIEPVVLYPPPAVAQ